MGGASYCWWAGPGYGRSLEWENRWVTIAFIYSLKRFQGIDSGHNERIPLLPPARRTGHSTVGRLRAQGSGVASRESKGLSTHNTKGQRGWMSPLKQPGQGRADPAFLPLPFCVSTPQGIDEVCPHCSRALC